MAKEIVIYNEDGTLNEEIQAKIDAKVAEIKEADKKVRVVFPILVEGKEYDDKEMYIGYFKQPSFQSFSKYLTAAQTNQAVAMRTLAKDCFIEGDKELIDDDSLFIFGLMGQLSKIIEMRNGTLVNLSKPGK